MCQLIEDSFMRDWCTVFSSASEGSFVSDTNRISSDHSWVSRTSMFEFLASIGCVYAEGYPELHAFTVV
jgi:hypothetical protein